jgi:ferredoxin-NADP reductase
VWHVGTVTDTRTENPTGRSLWLDVPDWPGNLPGQHVDVRLTAPDGYQAARSYSIASSGPDARIQLAVDRLPDGEVSPYLVDDVETGDQVEVRGPLGGWFVWNADDERPVQLIGGGSGVVPLVSMIRAHHDSHSAAEMRLLYSVRSRAERFFAPELDDLDMVTYAYTRAAPDGAPAGRLTKDSLAALTLPASLSPAVFVCGPTAFVEAVATWLVELGHMPMAVKTERFGG